METSRADPETVRVGVAEYAVGRGDAVITTSGLGSCLGVALHDERTPAGGLVHAMLPAAEEAPPDTPSKYVDTGVDLLVSELEREGADRADLTAKIAGGSDMFSFSNGDGSIGERNTTRVRAVLDDHGIPVTASDVGGESGRSVEFRVATGELLVRRADGDESVI